MSQYRSYSVSIAKLEEHSVNEDAVICNDKFIAVSDGAGGGGLYADLWSDYLVKHLPQKPFNCFSEFDQWIADIWEPFYNDREKDAKKEGGMVLEKFYAEGSFATLAVIWKLDSNTCKWIAYGDSVAFCYNPKKQTLSHSFYELSSFNNPPYLINCKDELNEKGYHEGNFTLEDDSIVFVASDALAHYILLMDALCHRDNPARKEELNKAIEAKTKNSKFVLFAEELNGDDISHRIVNLIKYSENKETFQNLVAKLNKESLLAIDDYSLAVFAPKSDCISCKNRRKRNAISKFIRILKCSKKCRR